MHQSRRITRLFGRCCLFLAALVMLCMPLAHAWHPPVPADAPTDTQTDARHAHHGHHAHDGGHAHHATCEDESNSRHDIHQRMQCDCLLCQLVKLPVLTPDLPTGHALTQRLPVLQPRHAVPSTLLAGHALRPPSRGPPRLRS